MTNMPLVASPLDRVDYGKGHSSGIIVLTKGVAIACCDHSRAAESALITGFGYERC